MSRKRLPSPIEIDVSDTELPLTHDNREFEISEEDIAAAEGKPGVGAVVLHHMVTFLQIAMVIALGTWAYLTFRDTSFLSQPDQAHAGIENSVIDAQLQRIEQALEVYRAVEDAYPPALDRLVAAGLLIEDDIHYPRQERIYVYQRFGDGFRLYVPESARTRNVQESEDSIIFEVAP